MSVQFLQSSTPQENQTIKVNDITCRGHQTIAEYLTVDGNATSGGILTLAPNSDPLASGKILLPAMSIYTQGTSQTTASIVINKTIVVMNKMGSTSALASVNDFVSITAAGGMTITRHNFGTGAAPGLQRLAFKLIQTA